MDRKKKGFSIGGLPVKYTCEDYRSEMKLVVLRKRLQEEDLDEEEKARIGAEIRKLEEEMGLS